LVGILWFLPTNHISWPGGADGSQFVNPFDFTKVNLMVPLKKQLYKTENSRINLKSINIIATCVFISHTTNTKKGK